MKTFPEDGIFVSDDDIELSKAPRDHTFSEKPLSNLQKDNTELSDETTLTEEPSDWSPNYLVAVGAVNEKSRHLAPPPSYRERTGSTQFRDDTFLTSDDIELESTSYVYQPRYSYPRVDISSPIGSDVSDKSLTPVDSSATHLTRKVCLNPYCIKHLLRYWPIFARSSTLHFAGAVHTRQNMTVHINNLVPSEFPNRSSRSAMTLISTLICI